MKVSLIADHFNGQGLGVCSTTSWSAKSRPRGTTMPWYTPQWHDLTESILFPALINWQRELPGDLWPGRGWAPGLCNQMNYPPALWFPPETDRGVPGPRTHCSISITHPQPCHFTKNNYIKNPEIWLSNLRKRDGRTSQTLEWQSWPSAMNDDRQPWQFFTLSLLILGSIIIAFRNIAKFGIIIASWYLTPRRGVA